MAPLRVLQEAMRLLLRFAIVLACACAKATAPTPDPSPPAEPASSEPADPARALRDLMVGVNAHVDILKAASEFSEYRDVLRRVERDNNVVAAEPFIFLEVFISSAGKPPLSFALKGVDPQRVARVLDLGAYMKTGKISDLSDGEPPTIVLGDVLANRLAVRAGDRVTVTMPSLDAQQQAREYPFRVTGTFHVGFAEYDERLAFTALAAAQRVANRGDQVMGIELKLKDIDQSAQVARALEQALGGSPYQVMDWYELNRQFFTAMFGERRP